MEEKLRIFFLQLYYVNKYFRELRHTFCNIQSLNQPDDVIQSIVNHSISSLVKQVLAEYEKVLTIKHTSARIDPNFFPWMHKFKIIAFLYASKWTRTYLLSEIFNAKIIEDITISVATKHYI